MEKWIDIACFWYQLNNKIMVNDLAKNLLIFGSKVDVFMGYFKQNLIFLLIISSEIDCKVI